MTVCFPTYSATLRRLLPVWIWQRGWRWATVWRTEASETDCLSGAHTHNLFTQTKAQSFVLYDVAKMRCLSQLAYQAWVTSVKTALRERQNRQGRLKRTEGDERADSHEALSVKGWIYLHRFLIRYWITRHPWSQTGKSVIYKSVRITCELVNDWLLSAS